MKYNKLLCGLLASAMVFGSIPAIATEDNSSPATVISNGSGDATPTASASAAPAASATATTSASLDISVAANYTESTKGKYDIILAAIDNIPDFTKMKCTVTITGATRENYKVLAANDGVNFAEKGSSITFSLDRTTAAGIAKAGEIFSISLSGASAAPSDTMIALTDFVITTNTGDIAIKPVLSFKAGSLLPTLTTDEKKLYDSIVATLSKYPDYTKLSFYQTSSDGKKELFSIKDAMDEIKSVQDSYKGLDNSSNVDAYLSFYNHDITYLDEVYSVLSSMYSTRGLIEIISLLEGTSDTDILNYGFLLDVYDKKKNINLDGLVNTIAYTDLTDTLAIYNSKKTVYDTALNSSTLDYEKLVYACDIQIDLVQSLSGHLYYIDYLAALKNNIADAKKLVNEKYTGMAQTKEHLLSCLDGYTSKLSLIENGAGDVPVMTSESVACTYPYKLTFTRKSTLAADLAASVRVIVKNESGVKIDEDTEVFPANSTKLVISMIADPSTYPQNEYIYITAYYVMDGGEFLIATEKKPCDYTPKPTGGSAQGIGHNINAPSGGGLTTGGTDQTEDTRPGGTLFPSNEGTDEPEDTAPTIDTIFKDLKGYDWAYEAIEGLYYAGIINGMEDGVFNPKGLVTREQFSKMVVQLFGASTGNTQTPFVDVDENAWYAPYVTAAMQAGYIQGQSDEYFGIGESIMRQDMAVILYRALGERGKKVDLTFTDVSNIAPYATDAISELVGLGVINGYEDGSFKPRGTATRAEAAKMIWEVYKIINNK